jgi:hypothetical protein
LGCLSIPSDRTSWIDTHDADVQTLAAMTLKTKRTYNLSETTVDHVRELAERSGVARTQDGIVEVAVERFYQEMRAQEEGALWAASRDDPDFRAEMKAISRDFHDSETWPE